MPKSTRHLLIILTPIAMIAIAILAAVGMVKSKPEIKSRPAEIIPPLVEISPIKFEDVRVSVRSQGTVEAKQKTKLIAFALLATIVPSVTLGALSYFQNRKLLQDKIAKIKNSL